MYKCRITWIILNEAYLNHLFNQGDSLLFSSYINKLETFNAKVTSRWEIGQLNWTQGNSNWCKSDREMGRYNVEVMAI